MEIFFIQYIQEMCNDIIFSIDTRKLLVILLFISVYLAL